LPPVAITKRLRYEVMRRDGHRCVYCGATAKETALTLDHVIAVALGGTDDAANLVTACGDCNAGKSSVVADEAFVARVNEDSQRWQRAMAAAVRIRRDARKDYDSQLDRLNEVWLDWHYNQNNAEIPRPANWRDRAEGFLVAGVPIEDLIRLVPVAMGAATRTQLEYSEWRYWVGCCKNVQTELEGTARRLLEAKDTTSDKAVTEEGSQPDAVEPEEVLCNECGDQAAVSDGLCIGCERSLRGPSAVGRELEPDGRAPSLEEL